MGLASIIARRSVTRRPGRTLFSILGVALGVATVVGVVTLDHATIEGYARPRQAQDRPDIELTAAGGIVGTSEALENLEGISAASRFFQNEATLDVASAAEGRPAQIRAQLYAIEARYAASFTLFGVEQGADLAQDAAEPQVLIGPAIARDHGVGLGDMVHLSRPVRASRKRCEDGVLVDLDTGEIDRPVPQAFRVVGILTREGVGRSAAGNVAVVDYPEGEALYRGTSIQPRFWAVKDPTVDLERLRRTLASTYSYALNKGVVIGQAADERAFRTGVRMLGLLALVLGLYVIFHTLSMSLTERVVEVGTLHALGSTRGQIGRVFFLEAAALSGAGAVLGAGLGVALAFGAAKSGITTLGVGKFVQVFHVPWATVALLALVGFAVALVGSVYPLVMIGGTNTLAAIRGEDALKRTKKQSTKFHLMYAALLAVLVPGLYLVLVPVVGEMTGELVGVLLGLLGVLAVVILLSLLLPVVLTGLCTAISRPLSALFPFAGRIATRAMQDAPARIGVSACAIGLVAAGFVGLHGMTASLRGEVESWAAEAVDQKVWVRGLPPTKYEDLASHLMGFPGILGVEKGSARQYAPFLIMGSDGPTMSGYGPFAAGSELLERFETERTILLSTRLAQDLDYAVGDLVQMKATGGQVLAFEVIGITDAYGYWTHPDERMYGLISDRWMEKDFCIASEVVTEASVRFDGSRPMTDDGHLGVLRAALENLHSDAPAFQLRPGVGVRDYALEDIGRDFIVFDLLLGLMAGLAALGVLNGMLLATLERTRELGVFKALGASRSQVGGAMFLEAIVVGVVGGGLGVLLGILSTPLIVSALDSIAGLSLEAASPGLWIPLTFAGAIVVAAVSSLYPIWRAHTVDAVRAVRTK